MSPFLSTAVEYVQDTSKAPLQLKAEEPLDGSRGYGVVDYMIENNGVVIVVNEVKKKDGDMDKGAAQNIMQMHSALEASSMKRKRKFDDDDNGETLIHGLVTCQHKWLFLRWTGTKDEPIFEKSGPYICTFEDDMKVEQQILEKLISMLLLHVENKHVNKRMWIEG